jgi:hypothetical protein
MRKDYVPLNVSVKPETKRQIEDLSIRKEMSVSSIVRVALTLYLDDHELLIHKGRKK